ncbi:MAG TPA: ATP-binding protein [Pseudolysinimonas sp.]|nr:ATP-binding protein [Pseudolysinimonas sp.]
MSTSSIPVPSPTREVANPLSLIRVDSAVARSAAGFGVAFFLQSIPTLLGQLPNLHPAYSAFIVNGMLLCILASVVASIARRFVKVVNGAFAIVYFVAIVSWPFAVLDIDQVTTESSWLYYLMTIATAMATIGFPLRIAAVYLLVIPTVYAIIRITPAGGDVGVTQAIFDSVYALILGSVITIIFAILRQAAQAVDRAQQTALERYSHAVRQHATDAERVQVDAIVHDSVLTTLLSAARAYTDEAKALASSMAGNAIGHLRDAVTIAPDVDAAVLTGVLSGRITNAATEMSPLFVIETEGAGTGSVPLAVAEAVQSAAVQAMVNSMQHAGDGTPRWVTVRARSDGIEVEIGDDGPGFDVRNMPTERLGVRVSIIERMSSAGGHAEVLSARGAGTIVLLRWPDERSAGHPEFEEFIDDEALEDES